MSIFNTNKTASIMQPITPDPTKNSFTEKISKVYLENPHLLKLYLPNFRESNLLKKHLAYSTNFYTRTIK